MIHKGSIWSQIWRFEAYDDVTGDPGDIDYIRIQPTGTVGYIRLRIFGAPPHAYGARHVKEIDLLTNADNTTEVHSLYISGDRGQSWGVSANNVGGLHVGGDLLALLHAGAGSGYVTTLGDARGRIEITTMAGAIAVAGNLLNAITANSLANVNINGSGPHTGNITVQGGYGRTILLNGSYAGRMSFAGNLSGGVTVGTDLTGSVAISNTLSGQVAIGGDLTGSMAIANDLTGSITVHDDVNLEGLIAITDDASGSIKVDDRLAGQIRIDGSLLNGAAENDVWIGTALDPTGAVAVDYNGWQDGDDWATGAVVRVGASTYTQNTATARVYEITPCRGDLNNDGFVDFGDINPFVLALTNPVEFATTYPGLDGSMVFHGDLDCDENLDFADINPFVVRLIEGCCREQCGPCPPPGNAPPPPMPEPAELAALLAANIDPELYDDLVALAAAVAAYDCDPEVAAYWQDVYEALTQ